MLGIVDLIVIGVTVSTVDRACSCMRGVHPTASRILDPGPAHKLLYVVRNPPVIPLFLDAKAAPDLKLISVPINSPSARHWFYALISPHDLPNTIRDPT